MTRFTLWGLMQYDAKLFENVVLPPGLDKEMCIRNIVNKSGDLYLYYQVPERAKMQITDWFTMHYVGFKRMIDALLQDYNPLENYDRHEDERIDNDWTRMNQASGSDNIQASGKDTSTNDIKVNSEDGGNELTENDADGATNWTEGKVSAFDANDYQTHDKTFKNEDSQSKVTFGKTNETTTDQDGSVTYGRKDTTTYGRRDDGTDNQDYHKVNHTHGNIGVTTNQKMLEEELNIRRYNIYDVIAEMFETDILIQIY